MKIESLFGHAAELFRIMDKNAKPSDKTAGEYFKARKYIGSSERKFISWIAFSAYRNKYMALHIADRAFEKEGENAQSKSFLGAVLLIPIIYNLDQNVFRKNDFPSSALHNLFLKNPVENVAHTIGLTNQAAENWINSAQNAFFELENIDLSALSDDNAKISELFEKKYSIPKIIFNKWREGGFLGVDFERWVAAAAAFRQSAPLAARVNSHIISIENFIKVAGEADFPCEKGAISPEAVIFNRRGALIQSELYRRGLFELQDEGSQIISHCLGVRRGDSVLDACAGAGGKSLHIAAIQRDSGSIVSTDIDGGKLKRLASRAKRAGLKSIYYHRLSEGGIDSQKNAQFVKKNSEGFDVVLVDAPCSGLGTARRDPNQKYKIFAKALKKLAYAQKSILSDFARFVKPGGTLVYATCSLLPEENDFVVDEFLESNGDFAPNPLKPALENAGIILPTLDKNDFKTYLTPDLFDSDGFFIARMSRQTV